jgi:hypothetical protein
LEQPQNVDFDRRIIRVIENRVYGNESSPKTNKSKRDVELTGPAFEGPERGNMSLLTRTGSH